MYVYIYMYGMVWYGRVWYVCMYAYTHISIYLGYMYYYRIRYPKKFGHLEMSPPLHISTLTRNMAKDKSI